MNKLENILISLDSIIKFKEEVRDNYGPTAQLALDAFVYELVQDCLAREKVDKQ